MDVRFRRPSRETSPDRAKMCTMQMQPRVKPIKKVQIVYYLSRNGHLEHPHYMEITHFANQPLRLRDVMDRLTALRGKGMPALYSWSCKRGYKNGYVWNDLAENDIIYPAEGAEYVLKGSELVEGCPAERLDQLQTISSSQQMQDSNFDTKRRTSPLAPTRNREVEPIPKYHDHQDLNYDDDGQEEQEVDYEDEKTSYTSSTTPHSRFSRGVSTDETEDPPPQTLNTPTVSTQNPSRISSNLSNETTSLSKRFEDGDPVEVSRRNSVLLQLIACGSSAVAKAKNSPCVKQTVYSTGVRKSSESFRKEVVCKCAVKVAEEDMIKYMSENPRFGNLQAEEKEYFSGSIVESMKEDRASAQPALKRSNSYNEERNTKAGLDAETVAEEKREKVGVKGKCLPRKLSSAASRQTRK